MSSARYYSPFTGSRTSRRDFRKLVAAAGSVLTFAPFVDWERLLPNTKINVAERAKAGLPYCKQDNIHTFPVNHAEVVIYSKTDDHVLSKESFRTWQLIRLPEDLGGKIDSGSSFRLYSMICFCL